MWFNNALIYQFSMDETSELEAALQEERLKPCPPHARFTHGWLPVCADKLLHEVAGVALICMGKEERILPKSVIQTIASEKIQALEAEQNRTVKRAERVQIEEDVEFDLLPRSFTVQKKLYAMLDKVNNQLIVNTSSATQATHLMALLRKSIPGFTVVALNYKDNLAQHFAGWIQKPETLPNAFQLAMDCLLFSPDNENKRIHCKGYEMPAQEVVNLIEQGMATAEISLIWQERIQFTLTQDFVLKKIKSLDYLIDEFNDISQLDEAQQQEDAALSLLAGELRQLSDALLTALGTTTALVAEEVA